jgi:hypothetical protein
MSNHGLSFGGSLPCMDLSKLIVVASGKTFSDQIRQDQCRELPLRRHFPQSASITLHNSIHRWHSSRSVLAMFFSFAHFTRRIVGFDDLGNTDNFSTAQLEFRLYKSGVISTPRLAETKSTSILGFTSKKTNAESDEDSDYD